MKIKNIMIFTNGNVAVFNEQGEQVPELQGSFYNYDFAKKLAKVIVKEDPKVEAQTNFFVLNDYIKFYKEHPSLIDEPEEAESAE